MGDCCGECASCGPDCEAMRREIEAVPASRIRLASRNLHDKKPNRVRETYTRSTPHADTYVNSDATAYVHQLEDAVRRIAGMPLEPRPDGTYNYGRNALVQIARDAMEVIDA